MKLVFAAPASFLSLTVAAHDDPSACASNGTPMTIESPRVTASEKVLIWVPAFESMVPSLSMEALVINGHCNELEAVPLRIYQTNKTDQEPNRSLIAQALGRTLNDSYPGNQVSSQSLALILGYVGDFDLNATRRLFAVDPAQCSLGRM